MPVKLITAPASEPVNRAEAKTHLRVTSSDEDSLIDSLIAAARGYAETYLQRALFTQTWELYLDDWPGEIRLPYAAPLQSVTSIKYYDTDGVQQTLATTEYDVFTEDTPGYIEPAYGVTWPSLRDRRNAITVRYVAGHAATGDIPGPIKSAILLLVGHLFENREESSPLTISSIPFGAKALMGPYRIIHF